MNSPYHMKNDVNLFGNGGILMTELSYKELKLGMLVTLTKPSRTYIIGPNNPKVGTSWECIGEVVDLSGGSIDVRWENGESNTYKSNELSAANRGRCKSIWD